jgi:hypothetical protein
MVGGENCIEASVSRRETIVELTSAFQLVSAKADTPNLPDMLGPLATAED